MKINFRKVFLWIFLTLLVLLYSSNYLFSAKRVAHAGGGIDHIAYTNSVKAIRKSIAKGFILIELNFSITKDNKIVCNHHWSDISKIPTLENFKKLNFKNKYPSCYLEDIKSILNNNRKIKIITDTKYDNYFVLATLKDESLDLQRFIPQVYDYEEYVYARKLGYKSIILTLYKYKSHQEVIEDLNKNMELYAITMNKKTFKEIGSKIKNILPDIPLYIHTINKIEDYCELKSQGVYEIYTDTLTPDINYRYCWF